MGRWGRDKIVLWISFSNKHEEQTHKEKETDVCKVEKAEESLDVPWGPLTWTSAPFGGLINEFKQRLPYLKSDFTDAFNPMCLAAIVFIFCSALSAAVAFGGLLGKNLIFFLSWAFTRGGGGTVGKTSVKCAICTMFIKSCCKNLAHFEIIYSLVQPKWL